MDHPSVCGPSFPAAVPGLIPADSPQFGTPGTGSLLTGKCPQQGLLSQGDFQLPVLHLLLSFNFWGENLLRQRTSTRKLRGESSQQKMEKGRSVLEARKMINMLWLSPWSTSTPRHSFGVSSGANKPWVCLLHCGDLKKPVLLPQWVPYTQLCKNIYLCTSLSWMSHFGNAGSIR